MSMRIRRCAHLCLAWARAGVGPWRSGADRAPVGKIVRGLIVRKPRCEAGLDDRQAGRRSGTTAAMAFPGGFAILLAPKSGQAPSEP